MYELTAHLLDVHGYDDVAFVAGPDGAPDSQSRYDGFRAALCERGRPVADQPELRGDFTTAGGEAVVAHLLQRRRMPRALVCANDQTAIGAMSALRRARVRIPADVAVTGFDGVDVGRHLHPALTTVAQPMRELGETVVGMLQRRIADPTLPGQDVELPVHVELRGSCGCRPRTARTRSSA
jgi:LacI family transcriptional regulator